MKKKTDFFINALHIFVLFSFAFAQPLFDLLSRNTEFFIAHKSEPLDVFLFILILCILLPMLVVLIEVVAGLLGRGIRKGVHAFIVAGLVAIITLQAFKKIFELPGTSILVAAAILGVGFTVSYIRFHPVRIFLTVLSPALLIFPGLFLFNSPVFKVVFPEKDPSAVTVKVKNPYPIIMVVFDEFPVTSLMDEHRRIDPIRYPNFAALARDSYWFRNSTSVAAYTIFIIPAMLTGNYPKSSCHATAVAYPYNIFTLLGGFYDLKVFEPITKLCPKQLCGAGIFHGNLVERMDFMLRDLSVVYLHILLPSDLTSGLPVITQGWSAFIKDPVGHKYDRLGQFLQFIDQIDSSSRPTLYFIHIELPHRHWEYLPSGKRYHRVKMRGVVRGTKGGKKWGVDDWLILQGYQRHLLQVGFVDKLLGKLIEKLKDVELYNRSLIVVTADHGFSFRPNDYFRVATKSNSGDILGTPLFIKAPNQNEGVINDNIVESIDILPTIADILGIQVPWAMDGHSALDKSQQERTKVRFRDPQKSLTFMVRSLIDIKQDTLKRKLALFGSGTKSGGLFEIGPFNHLIGRSIGAIDLVEGRGITVELDHSVFYANIDPSALFLPCCISGRVFLNNNNGVNLNLAISINGIIRAVTRTLPLEGGVAEWHAIVPETSFISGENHVKVFIVSQVGAQVYLECTRSKSKVTYSLAILTENSGEIITSSNGKSIPIIRDSLKGQLDVADVENDLVMFYGWAADIKNSHPAENILIFLNGKSIYSGCCNLDRPDVVNAYHNSALEMVGYRYYLPLSLFKNIENSEVRIFALSKKGIASELNYPKGYKWVQK
ncbi:MAG: sulfatase-like hydrolase/transferase [Deltaproteobacteria bacterium]|nr:sulfatase-like hydrolase/transferase [Deltaproteobacteria bacterium]